MAEEEHCSAEKRLQEDTDEAQAKEKSENGLLGRLRRNYKVEGRHRRSPSQGGEWGNGLGTPAASELPLARVLHVERLHVWSRSLLCFHSSRHWNRLQPGQANITQLPFRIQRQSLNTIQIYKTRNSNTIHIWYTIVLLLDRWKWRDTRYWMIFYGLN